MRVENKTKYLQEIKEKKTVKRKKLERVNS
jgi:hypothetical protein